MRQGRRDDMGIRRHRSNGGQKDILVAQVFVKILKREMAGQELEYVQMIA